MVPQGRQMLPVAGGSWGLGSGSRGSPGRPFKGRARAPSDLAHDLDGLPPSFCCRRCQCVFSAGPTWAPHCAQSLIEAGSNGPLWGGEEGRQGPSPGAGLFWLPPAPYTAAGASSSSTTLHALIQSTTTRFPSTDLIRPWGARGDHGREGPCLVLPRSFSFKPHLPHWSKVPILFCSIQST